MVIVGILAVGLALVGIFVPILPTTPFLLLAAFCFARSSDRFYQWLVTNRWFGDYIRNYRAGRGIPLREKIVSVSALWLTIGLSVTLSVASWWIRLLLLGIAVGVTAHLVRLPTRRRQAHAALRQDSVPYPQPELDSE